MTKIKFLLLAFIVVNISFAQEKSKVNWWNPATNKFPTIASQMWSNEVQSVYHRLPAKAEKNVREAVWKLSKHSAGLSIRFWTNASSILVKYKVKGGISMPHMPSTGVSGLDLYSKSYHGKWLRCWGSYSIKKESNYNFIVDENSNAYKKYGREYQLFLPLYNEVEILEIEIHLKDCSACRETLQQQQKILEAFNQIESKTPKQSLHDNFYKMLEEQKGLHVTEHTLVRKQSFSYKTAFQIAASIVLLFAGYFVGSNRNDNATQSQIAGLQLEAQQMKQNIMLAMIENQSPSKRIQAVNYTEELTKLDAKILTALVDRLQFDANSNVRLAAAEALALFSDNEMVKTALLEALSKEKDPSLQIELIGILVQMKEKRALSPIRKILRAPDTPSYVKDLANVGISKLI